MCGYSTNALPMPRLITILRHGTDDLADVRGGTWVPHALCGAIRRFPLRAGVSIHCTVRFDNNNTRFCRPLLAAPSSPRLCDRIVTKQDGVTVAEHQRSFGRGETVYDPWHYVPVLARKPVALRSGAPFREWVFQPRWRRSASD
jgi:hypothetical protein